MTREEWLKFGIEQGYCSPPVCATHDGWPTTDLEDLDDDACIHLMRPYASDEERALVEENFAPAIWRKNGWTE